MNVRFATPEDAAMLARIHVQAWAEAYADLLPAHEHAARGQMYRFRLWTRILGQPSPRVAVAPDLGFAQIGPQRDAGLSKAGYASELYSLYVLREAYGTGIAQALLAKAAGDDPAPFSALVLHDNGRACAFYAKSGGRIFDVRDDFIGQTPIRERAYVWDAPVRLHDLENGRTQ